MITKWQKEHKQEWLAYHRTWQKNCKVKYQLIKKKYYIKKYKDKLLRMLDLGLVPAKREEQKKNNYPYKDINFDCCVVCLTNFNLERHHNDYDKNKEVIPLCQSCHTLLHKRLINLNEDDLTYLKSLSACGLG